MPKAEELESIEKVKGLQILNPQREAQAVDALAIVRRLLKAAEKSRKELVDPFNLKVKKINAAFDAMTKDLETANAMLTGSIRDWRESERQRIADEQARVARENAEREAAQKAETDRIAKEMAARTEIEAKAVGMTEADAQKLGVLVAQDEIAAITPAPVEIAPVQRGNVAHGDLASGHSQMPWAFEILDGSQVPVAYCSPDSKKIGEAVKAGVRDMPGVRIFQKKQIVTKMRS